MTRMRTIPAILLQKPYKPFIGETRWGHSIEGVAGHAGVLLGSAAISARDVDLAQLASPGINLLEDPAMDLLQVGLIEFSVDRCFFRRERAL
jgi:hypothetical protein